MSKCPALYYSRSSRSEQHIACGTVPPRQSRGAPKAPACFLTRVPEAKDYSTALSKEGFPLPRLQAPWSRGLYVIQLHELCLTVAWQKACHVGPISHHCSDGSVTEVGSREHRASVYDFLFHRKALHILSRMNFFPDNLGNGSRVFILSDYIINMNIILFSR